MAVPQVPGDINQEDLINSVNNVVRELNNKEQVQIYKDEAGTRRVILDKDGLRTSPAGVDVYTATNDQLTFNSNNNVFKIVVSGEQSVVGPASIDFNQESTTTIPHNLGFVPSILVYVNAVSVVSLQGGNGIMNLPVQYIFPASGGGFPLLTLQARVDDTNLYIDFACHAGTANDFSSYTWDFKYYIFQETAN